MFSTTLLETFDCTCTLLGFSFSPRDLRSTHTLGLAGTCVTHQ